jgi:hypothetical protein
MIFQNGDLKWRKSGVVSAHELAQKLNSFAIKASF